MQSQRRTAPLATPLALGLTIFAVASGHAETPATPAPGQPAVHPAFQRVVSRMTGGAEGFKTAVAISQDGTRILAQKNMTMTSPQELMAVAAAFARPGVATTQGLSLAGMLYEISELPPDGLIGKKGTSNFVATKTNQAILIGVFVGDELPPSAAQVFAEQNADYLRSLGL